MSADLYLRVLDSGVTEADLQMVQGKPLLDEDGEVAFYESLYGEPGFEEAFNKIFNRDNACWIGQVSWLKRALVEDPNWYRYVPEAVEKIANLFGDEFTPVELSTEMVEQVAAAFELPNSSIFQTAKGHRGLADGSEVAAWLSDKVGLRLICVSE